MRGELYQSRRPDDGVLLLRPHNGKQMIAGVDLAPVIIPVSIDENCFETVHVTPRLEEFLGGQIFLQQVIDFPSTGRKRRLFVAEAQNGSGAEWSWLPVDEHRSDLADVLKSEFAGAVYLDRFCESVADQLSGMSPLPWCKPGWFQALLRRIKDYFSEPTEVHPYKLRVGYVILRAANSQGMYELHAVAPCSTSWWTSDSLYSADMRDLLQGWKPEVVASFPDLGIEIRKAPLGTSLARLGDLASWSPAMRAVADFQMRASTIVDSSGSIEPGALSARFNLCLQEWRAHASNSDGFGKRSLKWIQDSVSEASELLYKSVLPQTLINGALASFTIFCEGSRIQVSEWEPIYITHPFTTLARLLSHRSGALAKYASADLARPFVGAWLRVGRPIDVSQEVRAGVIVGSAIQATVAWERGRAFATSGIPSLETQVADLCQIILRITQD
ncbi:hypothetical protein AB0M95_40190 [Sphaerisporangium sp. NPDC051017]|uniref:hypothetical protein n=1 Tax=Sphaerisporangium sp. NPDC051017 TaxID=3154636 RepID=UPI00343425E6